MLVIGVWQAEEGVRDGHRHVRRWGREKYINLGTAAAAAGLDCWVQVLLLHQIQASPGILTLPRNGVDVRFHYCWWYAFSSRDSSSCDTHFFDSLLSSIC